MPNDDAPPPAQGVKRHAQAERRARLAAELRANLHRRKAQGRARAAAEADEANPAAGVPNPGPDSEGGDEPR